MKPVLALKEVDRKRLNEVGGKAANLGEMIQAGLPVPDGFVVTAGAYDRFLKANKLPGKIFPLLRHIDVEDTKALQSTAAKIQKMIVAAQWPRDLKSEIEEAYDGVGRGLVAVRSSATAEDLPGASFAGQQVTFLNIAGKPALLNAVKHCFASLFEARAIYYRKQKNFRNESVKLAVPVEKMVESEVAGVMFTADPVSGNQNSIVIEAAFGLGEAVVSGSVTPDHYEVDKKAMKITKLEKAKQEWQISYDKKTHTNKHKSLAAAKGKKQKLPDAVILKLAELAKRVEEHYGAPQDTEWAYYKKNLYLIQARPITTIGADAKRIEAAKDKVKAEVTAPVNAKPILQGAAASIGLASGPVKIIKSPSAIDEVKEGDVLVTEMTTPDYVPAMKRAAAIVTDTGGKTSHAAIVSRELGVPCVVGSGTATSTLKTGQIVTVDGNKGLVYDGAVETASKPVEANGAEAVEAAPATIITGTKVYVNVAEPEIAEKIASQPVDGVGLLRAEFILSGIGEHPKAMLKAKRGPEFVEKLSDGVSRIARAFAPRPVVYRLTDFKSNEYKNLKGGAKFEPKEENPMIGYRGASRYLAEPEVFDLEIEAIKKVRQSGLTNLNIMIPFVRTVPELSAIKKYLEAHGLVRSEEFKLWIMVEVPSAVIMLDQLIAEGIDGVSIGTNDLTQLTLGTDRDNPLLAKIFDERNPAVVALIRQTIRTCRKRHITCSVCGQAPSLYPEITELFVREGATSVSVTPDMIMTTRKLIASVEQRIMLDRQIGGK